MYTTSLSFKFSSVYKVSYTLVTAPSTISQAGPLSGLLSPFASSTWAPPATPQGSLQRYFPPNALLNWLPLFSLPPLRVKYSELHETLGSLLYLCYSSYHFGFISFSALKLFGVCLNLLLDRSTWAFCHSSTQWLVCSKRSRMRV